MISFNITITSVGFQRCNAFIPTLGSEGPQWGPVKLMCLSLRLYVWSSALLFGDNLRGQLNLNEPKL